ncbi:uncharacterized protein V1516DRAFT_685784 [Lipomyces oligophaga]|uniref:uncharacterized protein n=1 Tax=Lipomyces oligophaga TaxID=45792 RepID=UPI0034CEE955
MTEILSELDSKAHAYTSLPIVLGKENTAEYPVKEDTARGQPMVREGSLWDKLRVDVSLASDELKHNETEREQHQGDKALYIPRILPNDGLVDGGLIVDAEYTHVPSRRIREWKPIWRITEGNSTSSESTEAETDFTTTPEGTPLTSASDSVNASEEEDRVSLFVENGGEDAAEFEFLPESIDSQSELGKSEELLCSTMNDRSLRQAASSTEGSSSDDEDTDTDMTPLGKYVPLSTRLEILSPKNIEHAPFRVVCQKITWLLKQFPPIVYHALQYDLDNANLFPGPHTHYKRDGHRWILDPDMYCKICWLQAQYLDDILRLYEEYVAQVRRAQILNASEAKWARLRLNSVAAKARMIVHDWGDRTDYGSMLVGKWADMVSD